MYDDRDAAAYIAEHTGETMEITQEFIAKHLAYQASRNRNTIEAHSDEPEDDGQRQTVYLEAQEMSLDDLTMEVAYLKMQWFNDSRFSEALIARMIAEEIGYSVNIGIVPAEVYPHVSEWSAWVASL